MEHAQLQLVFNVVAITGVCSLAWFCYLLKKENRKLVAASRVDSKRKEQRITPSPQPAPPAPATIAASKQDIRHLAADQRAKWVKGLSATIS
jgi:hypothetical protein